MIDYVHIVRYTECRIYVHIARNTEADMTKEERIQACCCGNKEAAICKNCAEYCIHYVYSQDSNSFLETDYGHCIRVNNKVRKPHDTCGYFQNREKQTDG